jgi:hypothetical protein
MTLTLDLPEELERELATHAKKQGLSLPDYAIQLLRESTKEPLRTGADLVDYWEDIGVIGMRSDIEDSQAHARKSRATAEKRTSS